MVRSLFIEVKQKNSISFAQDRSPGVILAHPNSDVRRYVTRQRVGDRSVDDNSRIAHENVTPAELPESDEGMDQSPNDSPLEALASIAYHGVLGWVLADWQG